jgi:hypothetical protein
MILGQSEILNRRRASNGASIVHGHTPQEVMKMKTKVLSVRMSVDEAARVEEVALVEGRSASEIAKQGTLEYVDRIRESAHYATKAREVAARFEQRARDLMAGAGSAIRGKPLTR